MTLLPILRRIQRPTTQGNSSHARYENSQKIETYRNNHFQGSNNLGLDLPTEDARSDDPRLVSTCSFADGKTV